MRLTVFLFEALNLVRSGCRSSMAVHVKVKLSIAPLIILFRKTPVAFKLACGLSLVGVSDKEGAQ